MILFNSRGQSSFELVVIIGILFMIVLGVFGVVQGRMYAVVKDRNYGLLQGIGNVIRSEIDLAAAVDGTYYREFSLPHSVAGNNYSINVTGNRDVLLTLVDSQYYVFLNANISGNFVHGTNIIRKSYNNISVNI